MRRRPESSSLRFSKNSELIFKTSCNFFSRLSPQRQDLADSLPALMWLSTSLTWMTMPPCLTGRNTGDQRNMMTSRVDNIENLNVRVSIVEDIQPGTKFAKVNFFACFFFVSCLFKQSRVSHPLGYRELQSWSTKLIAIFHNFKAALNSSQKFLKLSWMAELLNVWLIYWREPRNCTKRHDEFC